MWSSRVTLDRPSRGSRAASSSSCSDPMTFAPRRPCPLTNPPVGRHDDHRPVRGDSTGELDQHVVGLDIRSAEVHPHRQWLLTPTVERPSSSPSNTTWISAPVRRRRLARTVTSWSRCPPRSSEGQADIDTLYPSTNTTIVREPEELVRRLHRAVDHHPGRGGRGGAAPRCTSRRRGAVAPVSGRAARPPPPVPDDRWTRGPGQPRSAAASSDADAGGPSHDLAKLHPVDRWARRVRATERWWESSERSSIASGSTCGRAASAAASLGR